MKNLSKLFFITMFVFGFAALANAQTPAVQLPRASQRAEIVQTVGDTRIALVYHRPNVNKRKVWGEGKDFLVPYGQVWRTGANENTTFEVSENVRINGQDLPAGKYGLHTIPNKDEWTIIFNKVNNEWGSFTYKPDQDALRVKVKPQTSNMMRETMMFEFDTVTPTTSNVVLSWEKLRIPFTVDVGDINARLLPKLRQNIANAAGGQPQAQFAAKMQAANFVLDNKVRAAYPEAMVWIDDSLKIREAFGSLRAKARISAEMGNYKDAIAYGERAISVGKAATPAINADLMANFEKDVASWKARK